MEAIYQKISGETGNIKGYPRAKTNIMSLEKIGDDRLEEIFKAKGIGYFWDDRCIKILESDGKLIVGNGPYYFLGEAEKIEFSRLERETYTVDEAADWDEKSQKVTRVRTCAIWKNGTKKGQ